MSVALPDGRGGPHAFVDSVESPELTDDDRHHLAGVLRLRPGDAMTVADGAGTWLPCRFGEALEPIGEPIHVPPPEVEVGVGFALIKGGRPEMVVQKLTELGVDRILVLTAERSVVRWDKAKRVRQMHRMKKVAREAAMQSRRVRLPSLEGVEPVGVAAAETGAAMAEPGGGGLDGGCSLLLVGPEGGWTQEELGTHQLVGLGTTILRAETAAIAAGVLMTALRENRG